ncbi:MAG: hypothetical protein KatS3mg115_1927 [Candidatus Poribacteria bacterium]|nr:MAG: hypothetical protein KatS3mg115_1927 [Candidatus Poribacteria bacterium]
MIPFFRRRAPSGPSSGAKARIERAKPADLEAIYRIERRSFPTPWSYGALRDEVTGLRPYSHVLVARVEAQVVGYVIFWVAAEEIHIVNIAVDPDFRRRGIGRQLLAAALHEARQMKLTRATLEVRPSNAPAIRLYESFGFQTVALRRGYYSDTGEDAYIMWLNPIPEEPTPQQEDQEE